MAVVGYFGGSFDPPHLGHTLLPGYVLARALVDELWVAPCWQHPLGKNLSPFQSRLAWTRSAMRVYDERVKVIDDEARFGEAWARVPRTIEVLQALAQRHPEHRFRLIVGSDIVQSGETQRWLRWPEIVRDFEPVVIPRAGWAPAASCVLPEVSSSAVRSLLAGPRDQAALQALRELVAHDVLAQIMPNQGHVWLIGQGRAGLALAPWLRRRGFEVTHDSARALLATQTLALDPHGLRAIWLVAGDHQTPKVAKWLLDHGQLPPHVPVFHASGARRADDLLASFVAVAQPIGTVHPICSLVGSSSQTQLDGAWFGVEGSDSAWPAALALAGTSRLIDLRPLDGAARLRYHAACPLAAGYLAALLERATQVMQKSGVASEAARPALLALMGTSLNNLHSNGIPAGISGPMARGDEQAIAAHLAVLDPTARELYQVLLSHLRAILASTHE